MGWPDYPPDNPEVTQVGARDADAADTLTVSTAILLRQAARRAADRLTEVLAPLGLHERHYGILRALVEGGPSSQNGLGQRLGIDRTTMVSAVDQLERLGYISRKPDPRDRRANRVTLTGRGRGRLVRATGAVAEAEAELLAGLSVDESQVLRALLGRIVNQEEARPDTPDEDTPDGDTPDGAAQSQFPEDEEEEEELESGALAAGAPAADTEAPAVTGDEPPSDLADSVQDCDNT